MKRHRCELTKVYTLPQAPGRMSISRGTELSNKLTELYILNMCPMLYVSHG